MKTLIIGFDAFDPRLFEQLYEAGKTPNLGQLVESGGYARFRISNPPQSEVSWTSIASGLNPGEHGMFDFVHRDPSSYTLEVSLLPTTHGLGGTRFIPPYRATTIFDQATAEGYPATSMWWPATFPAQPDSPVRTLPGLGTPDIHGRLGVGTLVTSDRAAPEKVGKTPALRLETTGSGRYRMNFPGPQRQARDGAHDSAVRLELDVQDETSARLSLDGSIVDLRVGQWSPILNLKFKLGWLVSVQTITRAILTQVKPEVRLYFLPLQLHPLHSPWPYGTPRSFVKDVWQNDGPFLTLGWAQDTTGLEDGCISDEQFLELCTSIFEGRVAMLLRQLPHFREGLLACVFDSLDRIQHMFWRDHPEVITDWYCQLDKLVAKVQEQLVASGGEQTRLVIVSDHGFNDFDYKVHLNRWLVENDYLTLGDDQAESSLKNVNWDATQAYAIGLNSLYLNRHGREGQGQVRDPEAEQLLEEIRNKLLNWQGPDGRPVVAGVWKNQEAFSGSQAGDGPDLVIGYAPGYRASSQTGLGAWEPQALELNRDHWNADHCIDPRAVPGVLFASQGLTDFPDPSYLDFPAIAIDRQPVSHGGMPKVKARKRSTEDEAVIEDRLKSLGYL